MTFSYPVAHSMFSLENNGYSSQVKEAEVRVMGSKSKASLSHIARPQLKKFIHIFIPFLNWIICFLL
jgi:hypothetical protein